MTILDTLEKINSEVSQTSNLDHLDQIVFFLKQFTDKSHHEKEERVLFPALIEAGLPRYGGPVDIMLSEHNVGRAHIAEMVSALAEIRKGNTELLIDFKKPADNYVSLLREHIYKEDNILYPIADIHLTPDKDEEIVKKFNEIDLDLFGAARSSDIINDATALYNHYFV